LRFVDEKMDKPNAYRKLLEYADISGPSTSKGKSNIHTEEISTEGLPKSQVKIEKPKTSDSESGNNKEKKQSKADNIMTETESMKEKGKEIKTLEDFIEDEKEAQEISEM